MSRAGRSGLIKKCPCSQMLALNFVRSHALAIRKSLSTVDFPMQSDSATWSTEKPPKNAHLHHLRGPGVEVLQFLHGLVQLEDRGVIGVHPARISSSTTGFRKPSRCSTCRRRPWSTRIHAHRPGRRREQVTPVGRPFQDVLF